MTEERTPVRPPVTGAYIYPETHWVYGLERNRRVWKVLRWLTSLFVKRRLGFSSRPFRVLSKKYLVVANHATDYDFLMLAAMFPGYLRFVLPERSLRSRIWGPVLSWLLNPISRRVAEEDPVAEKYIKTNLSLGVNLAMFPEHDRTMNGRTGTLLPDVARIIKESEGGLVTVKLTRGYLISPLWARVDRKGPTTGRVVKEYSREELDEMSVEEIRDALQEDLSYDVWEDQENRKTAYTCSAPAEGLENALFVCPACKRIGSLYSSKSDLICSCGYSQSLDKYGFFINHDAEFRTVLEWDLWQRNYLAANAESWEDRPDEWLSTDRGVRLAVVENGKSRAMLDGAMMTLYPDRIRFSAGEPLFSFPLKEMENLVSYRSRTLLFTWRGKDYEISKPSPWPTLRFVAIWRLLTQK